MREIRWKAGLGRLSLTSKICETAVKPFPLLAPLSTAIFETTKLLLLPVVTATRPIHPFLLLMY